MTPQRKRHQMLLLEEAMYTARMDFNRRFLALREVKRRVVTEINRRCVQRQPCYVVRAGYVQALWGAQGRRGEQGQGV